MILVDSRLSLKACGAKVTSQFNKSARSSSPKVSSNLGTKPLQIRNPGSIEGCSSQTPE